jgi:predicted solute-binding protein
MQILIITTQNNLFTLLNEIMSSITIAIPDNDFYLPLLQNCDDIALQNNFTIIRTSEQRCAELLLLNRADIALISPLAYGAAVGQVDYRIIPATAVSAEGFTGIASIFFSPFLQTITTIAAPTPDDFITLAGRLVLTEKFDIHTSIISTSGSLDELLNKADAAIVWNNPTLPPSSLDITEEWLDAFDNPLPIAFWVCRPEELPDNITEIIRSFATKELPATQIIHDHDCDSPESHSNSYGEFREGSLFWQWSDKTEEWLDQTLDALFYHSYIPAIPAVKIFGRDPIE